MATQPLKRDFYVLYRETTDDAARVVKDPIGYLSCRANVSRFLDIDDKAIRGVVWKEIESKARDLTIVDEGENKYSLSSENSDGKAAKRKYTFRKYRTGRSIRITTGQKTTNKNPRTIGFLFPKWADIPTIADALGELIPATKLSLTPSTSEIFPQFTLAGGGTYDIVKKAAADGSPTASVGLSPQATLALINKIGASYLVGA